MADGKKGSTAFNGAQQIYDMDTKMIRSGSLVYGIGIGGFRAQTCI